MWKYVAAGGAAIALIVLFLTLGYSREDRAAAASALVALEEAPAGDSGALESAYAKARAQIALIRSSSVRERASSQVDAAYVKKRESLADAKEVLYQALALISADHESLSALRAARERAEKLAGTLPSAKDVAALMSQISEIYDAKRRVIEERMAREQAAKLAAGQQDDEQQKGTDEVVTWIRERESDRNVPVVASGEDYCCCSRKFNTWGGDKWIHQLTSVADCHSSYRRGLETYYAGTCGETSYCGQ